MNNIYRRYIGFWTSVECLRGSPAAHFANAFGHERGAFTLYTPNFALLSFREGLVDICHQKKGYKLYSKNGITDLSEIWICCSLGSIQWGQTPTNLKSYRPIFFYRPPKSGFSKKKFFWPVFRPWRPQIGTDRLEIFIEDSCLNNATIDIKILSPLPKKKITKILEKKNLRFFRTFFGKIAVTQKLCFKSKFWHQVIFSS